MKLYFFNKETGEFLREGEAREDRARPGRFLIPRAATTEQPPTTGENEIAVWDGNAWAVSVDRRGIVYYEETGEQHKIKEIGEDFPENYSLEERPSSIHVLTEGEWVVDPQLAYLEEINKIKRAFREAAYTGVTIGGIPVQTDKESIGLVTSMWSVAKDEEEQGNTTWTTTFHYGDGSTEEIGIDKAKYIAIEVSAYAQDCFKRRGELMGLLESETITEADLETGWPSKTIVGFGE